MGKNFQDHFGKHAEEYSKSESHKSGSDLKQLIEELSLKGNETCIDMAAGTGFTAAELAKRAKLVYAIDATPEMLNQARKLAEENKLTNIKFILGRVENVPLTDRSADVITCRRAAHHFPDKIEFLKEARRLLKIGGKIGIVDMVRNEEDSEDVRNRFEILRDTSHVYAPKITEWKRYMSIAGFKNINVLETTERYSYERWLYPLKIGGPEDVQIRKFMSSMSDEFLRKGGFDPLEMTFDKKRMIATAQNW